MEALLTFRTRIKKALCIDTLGEILVDSYESDLLTEEKSYVEVLTIKRADEIKKDTDPNITVVGILV